MPAAAIPLASAQAGDGVGQRSLRILVAEDNPVNQKVAAHMLRKLGHRVELVGDGIQAMIRAGGNGFDVVLMGVQMPQMDGFEATAAIRNEERWTQRHLPIVAMTAHAMKGDAERCLRAGMDAYVAKPIGLAALEAAIAAALQRGHPAPAKESPAEMAGPPRMAVGA